MAEVAPLTALRYDDDELPKVIAPPYDVIGPELRKELGARAPHNIVHVDLPEGDGDARYANAARILADWRKTGVLRRDDRPSFLRYEQTFQPPGGGARITRRGFFALVRAEPYEKRVILPHERTLSGPKEDRYKLFRTTRTALSPVFLLYQDPSGGVAAGLADTGPTTRFTSAEDGIEHKLARISEVEPLRRIVAALRERPLLIADGHHRYETTLRYGAAIDEERAAAGLPARPDGAHKWVLAFLADADDPGLVVFPTHRLVRGVPTFSKDALLDGARTLFHNAAVGIEDVDALVARLAAEGKKHRSLVAVFGDGSAALLTLRDDVDLDAHPALRGWAPVLRRTDVVLLHSGILEAVLGITREQQAAQTNLAYYKIAKDAVRDTLAGEGQVLFLMNGTPVSEVRASCEAGEVMPQKSTFFYPKVPTGLVMHVLDPDDTVAAP